MDDELEDRVFYQTYVSHMKVLSKFAVGISSINSPLAYLWKLCRLYVLRPEVVICSIILLLFLLYLQAVDVWSRGLLERIQTTLGRHRSNRLGILESNSNSERQVWHDVRAQCSAFAIQGRRPRMEDRFIIEENIDNNTGISFFAIFDGHGGEFAADFAKEILVNNIYLKIIDMTRILREQSKAKNHLSPAAAAHAERTNAGDTGGGVAGYDTSPYLKRRASNRIAVAEKQNAPNKENANAAAQRRDSFRRTIVSSADDCSAVSAAAAANTKEADVFTSKLNAIMRSNAGNAGSNAIAKDAFNNNNMLNSINNNNNNALKDDDAAQAGGSAAAGGGSGGPPNFNARCYIESGKISFGKLITDAVLAADYKLVEAAKRATNIAGTTALIAIVQGSMLTVANVGDSRGVMFDGRGIAIPLSFDHKPQQVRERKRIHDAGGFIAFRGVWRVAGILATSRALGDYPLKDKNLVIANPDILTFDLNDHKPAFLVLASDGLWDTFTNEEACSFVREHLNEADFGAKSLAMQSYQRGSTDNITVLVIVFRNGIYMISSSSGAVKQANAAGNSNSNAAIKSSATGAAAVATTQAAAATQVAAATLKRTPSQAK